MMRLSGQIATGRVDKQPANYNKAGHHKAPCLWLLVIDSQIARFFRKSGNKLELIGESRPAEGIYQDSDLMDEEIGRTGGSGRGTARHKIEPLMSADRKRTLYFVHEIAEWLEGAVQKDMFDRLVLVAPPQMLGDLRNVLDKSVQERLLKEIDKNLTKMDEQDLSEELKLLEVL